MASLTLHLETVSLNNVFTSKRSYAIMLAMSIVEIETAIKKLPVEKVDELFDWLGKYHAEIWEKRIADDLDAGRLDSLLAEVDVEIEAGLAQPL
jgi:hypothetical protein